MVKDKMIKIEGKMLIVTKIENINHIVIIILEFNCHNKVLCDSTAANLEGLLNTQVMGIGADPDHSTNEQARSSPKQVNGQRKKKK
jgi:hypothetical protein